MSTLEKLKALQDRWTRYPSDFPAITDALLAYTIVLAEAAAIVNHTGGDDVGTLIGLQFALDAEIPGLE